MLHFAACQLTSHRPDCFLCGERADWISREAGLKQQRMWSFGLWVVFSLLSFGDEKGCERWDLEVEGSVYLSQDFGTRFYQKSWTLI